MGRPELLAEVNETIRGLMADTGPEGRLEWEFVCECGKQGCSEHVPLDPRRYDELRETRTPVLAPGHLGLRAETRRTAADLRADSFALRSDAAALRNEARHQRRRAARMGVGRGRAALKFRCVTCRYEACGSTPPRACPICRATRWRLLPPGG